jgi:hypothetical protein
MRTFRRCRSRCGASRRSTARELTTPNPHTILLAGEEPTREVADVLLARNRHGLRNRLTVLAPEGVLSPATARKLAASGELGGMQLPGIAAFTAPDSAAVRRPTVTRPQPCRGFPCMSPLVRRSNA